MRRHLPRLLLLGALLSPMTLYALGLGEIRLHSALNQPFDAEIELISPTADELAALKVGLASPDLYQRYGIDRPQYLSNFTFSVRRSGDCLTRALDIFTRLGAPEADDLRALLEPDQIGDELSGSV